MPQEQELKGIRLLKWNYMEVTNVTILMEEYTSLK